MTPAQDGPSGPSSDEEVNNMTVKELITYLETLPPRTRVFEDYKSELRELKAEDLRFDVAAEGNPIDDGDYTEEEWEELKGSPIMILGAWA